MRVCIAFKNPKSDLPVCCHQGLGITATNTAMALREMRIDADAKAIPNGETLWQWLAGVWSDYTHVVLSAPFIDPPYLGRLFKAFPSKKFALIYHSNLGFLSQDRFAVKSLRAYLDLESLGNFMLASNSGELSEALTAAGSHIGYLPNLFHLPSRIRRTREPWNPSMALNVGLFGAARILKNWLTAGVAAMIMQRRLGVDVRLHVSGVRDEGAAATRENLADLLALNPRVRTVEVPWLENDDFRRYLYGMDLLLQPSFSETFNNVTAEGCVSGVPSVVSDAVVWAPRSWKAKADSAISVAETGIALLRNRQAAEDGWWALEAHNNAAGESWKNWLEKKN